MFEAAVEKLRAEAEATNERRLLVLAGARERCWAAAVDALSAAGIERGATVAVGDPPVDLPACPHTDTESLLGTTQEAVVLDGHDRLEPNGLGRTVGTVAGGGLYVLLAPPLADWPSRRDAFDATLAVPPAERTDVSGHFRRRLVSLLRQHPGIAIFDVDEGTVVRDGLLDPAPRRSTERDRPPEGEFPAEAYAACRTDDQVTALSAFEQLAEPGNALVVAADRGRGKSSVAGLAAGALARNGAEILVSAPSLQSARPVFARAAELLDRLDALAAVSESIGAESLDHETVRSEPATDPAAEHWIESTGGGVVRFLPPEQAVEGDSVPDADAVVVDEAAAVPVHQLESFLAASAVAFVTTIHGYEGAGRGFSVRFRERLSASGLGVSDVSMAEPIRYAAGDPIEVWAFRALCLDASPPPDQLVADATPESVRYHTLSADELVDDEQLLREVFGLLVLAHYRTEPNDLARLLDAPNVSVKVLLDDAETAGERGRVTSVALIAEEGGLDAELRSQMYEGGRVRGNMLPDVLTGQLGDEAAATRTGWRVMRIATHPACRSRGLGSHLLERIETEARGAVDWVGTGFGATPALVSFWARNGYDAVHLSITRNDRSGEHSVLLLSPTSESGEELADRHAAAFFERIGAVLTDALSTVEPATVRSVLGSAVCPPTPGLNAEEWRRIARMAYGPGLIDIDPEPFRRLARYYFSDATSEVALSDRAERLLVFRVLQAHDWQETVDRFEFPSRRACMLATGEAYAELLEDYGGDRVAAERERFSDGA